MALPFAFTSVTAANGSQLDADFDATGNMGVFPCTVSGTNALTLTPIAGKTPTVAAYANYLRFGGVVAVTNTTAVTIRVGSLAALNAYKDSPSGPALLSGGELVAGNAFTGIYDSALNSGAGGFHIYTNTGFAGGTITGNMVLSGAVLSILGSSVGVTLSSTLLTGNSLSINGISISGTSLGASVASITSLQVGSTTSLATLTKMLSALGTLTFTATPASSSQDQNFAVPGAQVRDVVALGLGSSVPAGAGFTGFCGTVGTVTVRLINPTAASLSLASMTVRAMVMGLTP